MINVKSTKQDKIVKVALVGNPNSGKSTVFNALTGLNQKTGNYPGVTVDKRTGICRLNHNLTAAIIDLPGAYSLYPRAEDDEITFRVLCGLNKENSPDVVVFVADASNLKRNLLFCSQIIDLGLPVVLVLNMMDIAQARGIKIDWKKLSESLSVPVVPMNARKREGLDCLKETLVQQIKPAQKTFLQVSGLKQEMLARLCNQFGLSNPYAACHYAVYLALKNPQDKAKDTVLALLQQYDFSPAKVQGEEILKRYAQIDALLSKVISYAGNGQYAKADLFTYKLDRVLTHRVWGYCIFAAIMFLIFQAIFSFAEYPMSGIEQGFISLRKWIHSMFPTSIFTDLLTDGILAGVGGVFMFIPQIMLLFAFIAIMEDTGYMARVSFMMDKWMRQFGLHGKSVIPLIGGIGCAVPSIMATRNIDNRHARIITIMITPLMSCSARLPVYILLIGLVVPEQKVLAVFNLQGLVLMGLYLLGILSALMVAFVLKLLLRAKEQDYFMMELPIYRMPRWNNIVLTMIEKAKVFAWEAGKVIVGISVILWFMASFGPDDFFSNDVAVQTSARTTHSANELSHSFAAHLGKAIEPVIRPLGFDWKIGIALITSFAAREVFVGTMATLYAAKSDEGDWRRLRERMKDERYEDSGKPVYTLASVVALLLFYVFAMQCMSTVAVVYREAKGWKWPIIQIAYMTTLAYLTALMAYQILS